MKEILKKLLEVIFSFSGFLLSLLLMFVFGRREGKHQRDLEESEREKAMLKRARKIEEEVKNEFEKAKTPEEILSLYRKRTRSR